MFKSLPQDTTERSRPSYGQMATVGIALLWIYAIVRPWTMWTWEYYHDTPLLNYAGVLMHDFGMVPYRDIFETTMPGTFLFHYIVVGLGWETQNAFVALGIVAMFVLAGLGSLILLRLNRFAAALFAPFFLMFLLQFGPIALLQREILGLLAISVALLIATDANRERYVLRQGMLGLMFGIACTIKPQFALGAPVAVLCLAALKWDAETTSASFWKTALTGITASVLGFALPIATAFWWLWSYGALERFIFILTEYTPLYIQQTLSHEFVTSERRAQYLWDLWPSFAGFWKLLGGATMLLILTIGYRAKIERRVQIILASIVAMAVIYGHVPILSGQFWDYHYFPFIYFGILTTCALLTFVTEPFLERSGKIACLAIVAFTLFAHIRPVPNLEWRQEDAQIRLALTKEMETALNTWVPEGGRVQPIDWTVGALHAMMQARVPIATRFFYDFHFAHHVDSAVTTGLRREFIGTLTDNPPEVLLVALTRLKLHGLGVSYDFPELDAFRDGNYIRVQKNKAFEVYLRRDLAS